MDQDLMLLLATGACAIAAAVLAVAAAWVLRLDQRLGLSRPATRYTLQDLVDTLSAVGEDPVKVRRLATELGGSAGNLILTGLRLARERAEPLAFGRELLAFAARASSTKPLDRRIAKFVGLGALAASLTVVAWALPLLVDTAGWERLAVGLGYVGVLALFASVALSHGSHAAVIESQTQASRLAVVAFLGLSVGESREQIRARLLEAATNGESLARPIATRAA